MGHALSVVDPAYGLRYHDADINHFQLVTSLQLVTWRTRLTYNWNLIVVIAMNSIYWLGPLNFLLSRFDD